MKDFELQSKDGPWAGSKADVYTVEYEEYPRCTLGITNLSRLPETQGLEFPSRIFDVTDGEGTRYYYEVAIIHVEDDNVSREELQKVVEDCWDWWLSDYLL